MPCYRTTTALTSPKLLPFDHVFPDPATLLEPPEYTAVLYANIDSTNFRKLHEFLFRTAPSITYVFRPIPSVTRDPTHRAYLSGYGVALDLKKMDYLAVDDRLQAGSAKQDSSKGTVQTEEVDPIVALLQQYPMDESVDVTLPLTDEELLGKSILRCIQLPF